MSNRKKSGRPLEEKQERTDKGQFASGVSGNPSGRPKKTEEEKNALEKIRGLTMDAADQLEKILKANNVSAYAKLQAIEIVLSRAYGRPETMLKLETSQQSFEESSARIHNLVEEIQARRKPS